MIVHLFNVLDENLLRSYVCSTDRNRYTSPGDIYMGEISTDETTLSCGVIYNYESDDGPTFELIKCSLSDFVGRISAKYKIVSSIQENGATVYELSETEDDCLHNYIENLSVDGPVEGKTIEELVTLLENDTSTSINVNIMLSKRIPDILKRDIYIPSWFVLISYIDIDRILFNQKFDRLFTVIDSTKTIDGDDFRTLKENILLKCKCELNKDKFYKLIKSL